MTEHNISKSELVLVYLSRHSLLPELYAELGGEVLAQLINIFGGLNLRIPSQKEMDDAMRDVTIYLEVSHREDRKGKREACLSLASRYNLNYKEISRTYVNVHREMEEAALTDRTILSSRDITKNTLG